MKILGWLDAPSTAAHHIRLAARAVFFAGCLLLPVAPFASAQSTTADITGTVTDVSGASLPHASVTLTNLGTSEQRTAQTTDAGDYTFTQLGPGTYSIQVSQSGFKSFVIPNIALSASDRARRDAKLEVGSGAETVQVTGQAPPLQSDSSVLTTVITQKATQDLPLNGRNYVNLAQLAPGANEGPPNGLSSGGRPDDRRLTSGISVNGQSDTINDWMIDGLDNNERIIGTTGIRPSSTSRPTPTPPKWVAPLVVSSTSSPSPAPITSTAQPTSSSATMCSTHSPSSSALTIRNQN
jgi:hypothetical protein